jgi:glycosyltransferase involved in cell wall biosynthesis
MPHLETIVGLLYLCFAIAAWPALLFVMVKGRKRMRLLFRPGFPLPPDPPQVSILVPAKDEAHQIESCVRSILRQDYPNFEIVAVNDRSVDATGRIFDRLGAEDPRVRPVHLSHASIPPGWGGKSYALHCGLEHARGEWLLFVDADVELEPDALSQSLAVAVKREFDLVSLLPKFIGKDFWERLLQPLAGAATAGMFAIALTNSNQSRTAFANGQFLLVKRSAYDAVGGHEAIRGTLSEDVALARKLKEAKFRPRLSWADDFARVRMYEGLGGVIKGWGRNFYVGSHGRPWRMIAAVLFILVFGFAMWPALAWGIHRLSHPGAGWTGTKWIVSAGLHWLTMTAVLIQMYRWSDNPWWNALLWPVGAGVLIGILCKSMWTCATGRVEWRGTTYSGATGVQAVASGDGNPTPG